MPLKNYSVLKGAAIDRRLGTGQTPHYQMRVVDDTQDYRIAVNVMSALEPSTLEFLVDTDFRHPIKGGIITLLNDDGLRVDGVSYTKAEAQHPGWTVKF